MAFMAFMCIFLGVYPKPLYDILPYEIQYNAYTYHHVLAQLQLLMLSALVFFLFLKLLKRTETISIDTDWFYRKGGRLFYLVADKGLNGINSLCSRIFEDGLAGRVAHIAKDAPAKVILWFVVPAWFLSGSRAQALTQKKEALRVALRTGTVPVGIGAAVATVFLAVVFLLL